MGSPRILFLTTNGAGLGHLTRSVAIGRRLPDPVDYVVFTLSQAAPIIADLGVVTEFMYSHGFGGIPVAQWHDLYRHRLHALLDRYEPTVVSFDGTYPYRGLVNVIDERPDLTWVWCRRAMWKPGVGERNLELAEHFAHVMEPGEFAREFDRGATTQHRGADHVHGVAPVVQARRDELLDRTQACRRLGIDPDGTNVLVQLGAGNNIDTETTGGFVIRRLLDRGATVVVPVSPIMVTHPRIPDGAHTVSVYPLAPLLPAFDASVAATGYNTFHELVHFAVPSLFVPVTTKEVDDQLARARWADTAGVGLAVEDEDQASLARGVDELLDPHVRARLAAACRALDPSNGADEMARLYADIARSGHDREPASH